MNARILIAALAATCLSTALWAQDAAPPAETTEAAPPAESAEAAPSSQIGVMLTELAQSKPGDAEAGAGKAAVCGACHGMTGNSSDPQYPKLAGQHENFIARQLTLFKAGERVNPIMYGFSVGLSAQDMRDLGAHYAKQKVEAGLADESLITNAFSPYKDQRIVDVGESIYRGGNASKGVPASMACHGPSGAGNPGPSYPAVAGQHAAYVSSTLNLYKSAAPDAPLMAQPLYVIMNQIASRMSEEEIIAVSSYIEGLHARDADATAQAAH